jgi:hypothetical protein
MKQAKRWLPLLALALVVGAVAAVRERRIAAIETEYAVADRAAG